MMKNLLLVVDAALWFARMFVKVAGVGFITGISFFVLDRHNVFAAGFLSAAIFFLLFCLMFINVDAEDEPQAIEYKQPEPVIHPPQRNAKKEWRGCLACYGSGGKKDNPCTVCAGTGRIHRDAWVMHRVQHDRDFANLQNINKIEEN